MTIEEQQITEILEIMFKWDKALRGLERRFNKEFDLTLNQCRVILHVQNKGYVELSQINSWLNIDKSTTTRMIRPLLVRGFIDKFYMFGDKRKIYLKISEKGMENVDKIKVAFDRLGRKSLVKVPAGKRELVFQMTNDLIKAMV